MHPPWGIAPASLRLQQQPPRPCALSWHTRFALAGAAVEVEAGDVEGVEVEADGVVGVELEADGVVGVDAEAGGVDGVDAEAGDVDGVDVKAGDVDGARAEMTVVAAQCRQSS